MSAHCVHELVRQQAVARPTATAVSATDATLTYAELVWRADLLAARLRALDVGKDTLVAVCLPRSANHVVAGLGVLSAGGAYVALDPSHPEERLGFMIRDSNAPVVVTTMTVAARLEVPTATIVAIDDPRSPLERQHRASPERVATPRDLAYAVYTSGSTGAPKAVLVEHAGLLNLVRWHCRTFGVTVADRTTQIASPAFDAAVWELWPTLVAGGAVHVPSDDVRSDPRALRDWLVRERITVSFLPTALAEAVIALDWPSDASLRYLLTGGDSLHNYPRPGLPFTLVNNYGPAEGTVVATSGVVAPCASARSAPSIGRPIDNVVAYIVDEHLVQVAPGAEGELLIGGAGLARGYLNRPDLTAARFIDDACGESGARLYRTGDLVRLLRDGEIQFLGRTDEQVEILGHRIEPGEISASLDRHPAVRSSTVVAREYRPGEMCLVAYAVPADGVRPGVEEIRAHLARTVPDYMLPAAVVWLEELPVTANGKIDRAALPAPHGAVDRPANLARPRNEGEAIVAATVAEILGLSSVGIDENFFMLGGHSLLGAQLIARIADRFGVEMDLRTLFDNPTVAAMGVQVERLLVADLETMSDDEAARLAGALAVGGA